MITNARRKVLEKNGWAVGSTQDFLQLTDEENALITLKIMLGRGIRKRRSTKGLTQSQLAQLLNSSQSRVARIEAGDATVSLDLLVRSLYAMGATNKDIARLIKS